LNEDLRGEAVWLSRVSRGRLMFELNDGSRSITTYKNGEGVTGMKGCVMAVIYPPLTPPWKGGEGHRATYKTGRAG
jgi:hypothetical protein